MQPKEVKINIRQGEIDVNVAWEDDAELKVIFVDLVSKYADVIAAGCNQDGYPEVILFADNERPTLHTNADFKGCSTLVSFSDYKGWGVYN